MFRRKSNLCLQTNQPLLWEKSWRISWVWLPCMFFVWTLILPHRLDFLPCPCVCLSTFLQSTELWLSGYWWVTWLLLTVSGSDLGHGCALLAWLPCLISYSLSTYLGSGLVTGLSDCHPAHFAQVCGIVPFSLNSFDWFVLVCAPGYQCRAAFSCYSLHTVLGTISRVSAAGAVGCTEQKEVMNLPVPDSQLPLAWQKPAPFHCMPKHHPKEITVSLVKYIFKR